MPRDRTAPPWKRKAPCRCAAAAAPSRYSHWHERVTTSFSGSSIPGDHSLAVFEVGDDGGQVEAADEGTQPLATRTLPTAAPGRGGGSYPAMTVVSVRC